MKQVRTAPVRNTPFGCFILEEHIFLPCIRRTLGRRWTQHTESLAGIKIGSQAWQRVELNPGRETNAGAQLSVIQISPATVDMELRQCKLTLCSLSKLIKSPRPSFTLYCITTCLFHLVFWPCNISPVFAILKDLFINRCRWFRRAEVCNFYIVKIPS